MITKTIIKCPHCGQEYLPEELFAANSFLGKPQDIVKDSFGKIIYSEYPEGEEPVTIETYICDKCENSFIVEATITYKAKKEADEFNFKNEFTSLL